MRRTLKMNNGFPKNFSHDTKENKKRQFLVNCHFNFRKLTQLFNLCRETKYGGEDNTQSDCS